MIFCIVLIGIGNVKCVDLMECIFLELVFWYVDDIVFDFLDVCLFVFFVVCFGESGIKYVFDVESFFVDVLF